MASITLYSVSKRVNSTAIPSAGLQLNGTFKTPVDVLNPVLTVEQPAGYNFATTYNYAYISDTNKYYWITAKTAISEKLFEMRFAHDALANWKRSIGASTQYVTRSSSEQSGAVRDNLYPFEAVQDVETVSLASSIPWYSSTGYQLTNGWYVIGVLNKDDAAVGSAAYYAMNYITFQNVREVMFSDASYTDMRYTQIEEPLYKSLFNPMQYIVSCMWFPLQPTRGANTDILFLPTGWFSLPAFTKSGSVAYRITDPVRTDSFNLPIKLHPQAATRGRWMNTPPTLQRTLYIEPFGAIDLDTAKLGDSEHGVFTWWVDFVSGEVRARVTASATGAVIGEGHATLGVSVELAQTTHDPAGLFAGGLITKGVDFLTGSGAFNASAPLRGLRALGQSAIAPNVQSAGSFAGSLVSGKIEPVDMITYTFAVNDDNADRGRPLCGLRTISNIPGFVQVDDPQVGFVGCLAPERDAIRQFMADGFFYE